MNKTRFWILLTVLSALAAAATSAAPLSLALLERPAGVEQVSLSPSGSRVAAVFKGRDSDSDLAVFEQQSGKLVPVLATRLSAQQAIGRYTWLSDDFLAIYYVSADQDFPAFSIANLPKHSIEVEDPLTVLVKTPWGDADHILLSVTGKNCPTATGARCLMSQDLRGSGNLISEPFTLQAADFLAVSPTEIYASGRDAHGVQQDFTLETATHFWKAAPTGTLQRRRVELARAAAQLPQDVLQQEASADMQGATPVWTEPDHHLVGLAGHAPQRAFLALDPRLMGLQALLEQKFPDERVEISRLNPTLTRGMVQIWGPDQPPLYLMFNDAGGLTQFPLLTAHVSPAVLGKTIIERDWADGMPVAMTLPPDGTALIGAVVEPVVVLPGQREDPLETYDGIRQAFAQRGIAVVHALVVMPGSFSSNAAGGEWRQMHAAEFQHVIEHTSDLVRGKPVCLLGSDLGGALALQWSGLPHVGCVVANGALLDSKLFGQKVQMFSSQGDTKISNVNFIGNTLIASSSPTGVNFSFSTAQLHREAPALFGMPGSENLADPVQWVAALPPKVMLAYDEKIRIEAEYAAESANFRAALKTAGKALTYYTAVNPQTGNVQAQQNLAKAELDYVQEYFAAVAAH